MAPKDLKKENPLGDLADSLKSDADFLDEVSYDKKIDQFDDESITAFHDEVLERTPADKLSAQDIERLFKILRTK